MIFIIWSALYDTDVSHGASIPLEPFTTKVRSDASDGFVNGIEFTWNAIKDKGNH